MILFFKATFLISSVISSELGSWLGHYSNAVQTLLTPNIPAVLYHICKIVLDIFELYKVQHRVVYNNTSALSVSTQCSRQVVQDHQYLFHFTNKIIIHTKMVSTTETYTEERNTFLEQISDFDNCFYCHIEIIYFLCSLYWPWTYDPRHQHAHCRDSQCTSVPSPQIRIL